MDRQDSQPLLSDELYNELIHNTSFGNFSPSTLEYDSEACQQDIRQIVSRHCSQPIDPAIVS